MSLAQRLRHRVAIQEQVDVVSTAGQYEGHEWRTLDLDGVLLDAVPAEVLTGPGREFEASNAKQAETTARITLRWFPQLLPTHRILWDGRVYGISSMDTDATGRKEWRLRCEDGVNDGS
jgi:head-tail adaptor